MWHGELCGGQHGQEGGGQRGQQGGGKHVLIQTREDRRILSQRGGHYVKAYRKLLAGDYIMKGIFKYN